MCNSLHGDCVLSGELNYDVAVLGAGIGGYVSAIRSAQLGKKVVLIEKEVLGGTCLNIGCIPTKAFLGVTDFLEKAADSENFGAQIDGLKIDFQKVMARKDSVVSRLSKGVEYLLRKNRITLINGRAKLISKNQVSIQKLNGEEEVLSVENIV